MEGWIRWRGKHHFAIYAPEKLPYAIDRYVKETNRLYGVIERRLCDHPFLAGDYSMADTAAFPWIVRYQRQGQRLEDFPKPKTWFDAIHYRPAVINGLEVGRQQSTQTMSEEAKKVLKPPRRSCSLKGEPRWL